MLEDDDGQATAVPNPVQRAIAVVRQPAGPAVDCRLARP